MFRFMLFSLSLPIYFAALCIYSSRGLSSLRAGTVSQRNNQSETRVRFFILSLLLKTTKHNRGLEVRCTLFRWVLALLQQTSPMSLRMVVHQRVGVIWVVRQVSLPAHWPWLVLASAPSEMIVMLGMKSLRDHFFITLNVFFRMRHGYVFFRSYGNIEIMLSS